MSAAHTPMVVAAARALCKRASEACGVDEQDNWKTYGDEFLADAKAILDAAGAPELLEALQRAERMLGDFQHLLGRQGARVDAVLDDARAAIAKATGGAQ